MKIKPKGPAIAIRTLAKQIGWLHTLAATGGLSGYAPFAPGTVGTLIGIPLYLLFIKLGTPLYVLSTVAVFVLGMYGADRIEAVTQQKDHSIIVIDEIVGYLVTMWLVPVHWSSILLGFVAFRVFDIVKPYPARTLDNNPNLKGFGVMIDDVVAGVYGNIVLQILVRGFLKL